MSLFNDYFIIESVNKADISDGKILNDVLNTTGNFNPIYRFVKCKKEFERAINEFCYSDYKNLFISSHGDEENIILTNEKVNIYDIEELNFSLLNKRIFMSTCCGGSYLISKYLIKKGAFSVIGTPNELAQSISVPLWSTMTILFNKLNENNTKFSEIDKTLKLLVDVYEIKVNYFSFIRNSKKRMKMYSYIPNKKRKRENFDI